MTPAKKATPAKETVPSLADLVGNKNDENPNSEEEETVMGQTENGEPVIGNAGSPALEDSDNIYAKPIQVDPSKDHVHTWEENHDQNLATVHPDVIVTGQSSEQTRVSSTVFETVYAEPAELDDKGLVGPEEEFDRDEDYVDEDDVNGTE